jgi:hypothetical protein
MQQKIILSILQVSAGVPEQLALFTQVLQVGLGVDPALLIVFRFAQRLLAVGVHVCLAAQALLAHVCPAVAAAPAVAANGAAEVAKDAVWALVRGEAALHAGRCKFW